MADPVADLLRKQPMSDAMRADVWDAYQSAADEDALVESIKSIRMPESTKAALWDLKHGDSAKTPEAKAKTPAETQDSANPSDSGALLTQGAAAAAPKAANLALEVATNPKLPAAIGKVARVGTTLGAIGQGVATLNPSEVIAAPRLGWTAGRGGYFLGKGIQSVAGRLSTAAGAAAPMLSGLSGAQGVGDLAQMAEPERKDIGVLGMSGTADVLSDPKAVARVVNASPSIGDAIANLKQLGMSQAEAVKTVLDIKWLSRRLEKR